MSQEQLTNQRIAEAYGEKREQEINPELVGVAKNVVDCYDFNPEKESFLVITDTKVMELNADFIAAIEEELKQRTGQSKRAAGNYEIVVIPASPYSATPLEKYVGDKMKNQPILLVTSMSRSHSRETGAAYRGDIAPKKQFDQIIKSKKLQQTIQKGWSVISPDRLEELNKQTAISQEQISEDNYYAELVELAKGNRSRIISITKGHNPYEILTKGAVEESVEALRERGDEVNTLMQDVAEVHITTDIGTDLVLRPRPDKTEIEDGRMNKPGQVSNYPIGEWSCSPYLEGANGTLVVDIAAGGNHNKDQFDEYGPIKLEIKDGVVISMGDKQNNWDLNKLKDFLSQNTDYNLLENEDKNDPTLSQRKKAERNRIQKLLDQFFGERNIKNPLVCSMLKYWVAGDNRQHHCFRLAEFAVGTNAMACKEKTPENIGSSEGEKILGTVHIAVGSNGTFGVDPIKDHENFNNVDIHCDMIISKPTVECTKKDNSKFNLIENGEPAGY